MAKVLSEDVDQVCDKRTRHNERETEVVAEVAYSQWAGQGQLPNTSSMSLVPISCCNGFGSFSTGIKCHGENAILFLGGRC